MDLLIKTLEFAIPVLITIFLGLFSAGIIIELGILKGIASYSRPLVSIAHLPEICASSFVVSLGSTVAANSMIAQFRESSQMEDKEAFLCASINSIPAYIREIFTYQIPIVIPALGFAAGSIYAMIFMVTAIVKVVLVVILGRTFLEARTYHIQDISADRSVSLGKAAVKAFKGQLRLFSKIAAVYLIMTFFVFGLRERGSFEALNILPLASLFRIPPESMVPLATYIASPIMGLSMLGPMINSGSISSLQALVVLMLGSMLMLPVFAMRSMVPNYIAIFGARLGLSVVFFSTGVSMLVRLAFLLAFLRMV